MVKIRDPENEERIRSALWVTGGYNGFQFALASTEILLLAVENEVEGESGYRGVRQNFIPEWESIPGDILHNALAGHCMIQVSPEIDHQRQISYPGYCFAHPGIRLPDTHRGRLHFGRIPRPKHLRLRLERCTLSDERTNKNKTGYFERT